MNTRNTLLTVAAIAFCWVFYVTFIVAYSQLTDYTDPWGIVKFENKRIMQHPNLK
jgi:hypothetical protein